MFIFVFIDHNHVLGNAMVETMISPNLAARRSFKQDPVEQIHLDFDPLPPTFLWSHVG